jgi:hypothetical protein
VKFQTLPIFTREYQKLSAAEREKFREALSVFIAACKEFEQQRSSFDWPASLRFEKLIGFNEIYAITWSFRRPDGRATFQMKRQGGEIWIICRRVGRHAIYKNP